MAHIQYSSVIPAPRAQVFDYLKDYRHLSRLMPSHIGLAPTGPLLKMQKGAEYEFKLHRRGLKYLWVVKIEDFREEEAFVERQLIGLFESWLHTYQFEAHGEENTLLTNIVEYKVPFGLLGKILDDTLIKSDLTKILHVCHEKLKKKAQSGNDWAT